MALEVVDAYGIVRVLLQSGLLKEGLTCSGLDYASCGMLVCGICDLLADRFICSRFSLVSRINK